MQLLASHNSYKAEPYAAVFDALRPDIPDTIAGLEYFHRPLTEQFDELGVRAIELDVWADPEGGKYAAPAFPASVGVEIPDDPVMRAPGFKVMHQNEIDTHATCVTLVLCLTEVREWSEAHPAHVPMMIQLEVKDEAPDAAELDALDAEIRSVFDEEHMITPDDVRGDTATLGAAVAANGWPVLGEVRGKVLFTLDNGGLRDLYLAGHPSLARTRAVHTVVTRRRRCRVRQAQRPDRRRRRDPSRARRATCSCAPAPTPTRSRRARTTRRTATPRSRAARSS